MDPGHRDEWLDSHEGKMWMSLALMLADAKSFTRVTIVMVIWAIFLRIHDIPDRVILFTFIMWLPTITALKCISAASAKRKFLEYRKKTVQK